jgi:DNA-binding IclR family transcriptional regulator
MVEAQPIFERHSMYNVLVDLADQGLVTTDGDFRRDDWRLTDRALKQFGDEELPPPLDIEGRMIQLLEVCGPLGTGRLSRAVGRSASPVRAILRKLTEEGKVIPEGRGSSRRYRLGGMTAPAA